MGASFLIDPFEERFEIVKILVILRVLSTVFGYGPRYKSIISLSLPGIR